MIEFAELTTVIADISREKASGKPWVEVTTVLANIAVIIGIGGLVAQWVFNWGTARHLRKEGIIACNSRYYHIQELLFQNRDLDTLSLEMKGLPPGFKNGKEEYETLNSEQNNGPLEVEDNTIGKELALCAMIFQLMEDVWITHDLEKVFSESKPKWHHLRTRWFNRFKKANRIVQVSGWMGLFEDWMEVDRIWNRWDDLKRHFRNDFVAFVKRRFPRTNEEVQEVAELEDSKTPEIKDNHYNSDEYGTENAEIIETEKPSVKVDK